MQRCMEGAVALRNSSARLSRLLETRVEQARQRGVDRSIVYVNLYGVFYTLMRKQPPRSWSWKRRSGNTRGLVWMLAAALSQSLGGAGHKVVVAEVPNVQTLVFMRALAALVLLLPVVLASRGHAIRTRNVKLHVIRGLLIAIHVFCSTYAVTRLTLAEANAYALSTSLFLLPLGGLLLSQRAHWLRWVGGVIGFVGVLVIVRPGFSGFRWAAIVALLGALASALLSVVLKHVSGGDGAVAINFWSLTASALIFGIATRFQVP